jgi:hypothetical protein
MIATLIAWTIFMANPMGTLGPTAGLQAAPYFFPNESETREYASQDLCMADVRQAKEAQANQLQVLNTVDNVKYYTLKAKYDSLVCKQVTRQVETNTIPNVEGRVVADAPVMTPVKKAVEAEDAKQTETEYLVRYQIGRFDIHQVFHGTDYDASTYSTRGDCEIALKKIKLLVLKKALDQGGANDEADEILMRFKMRYACQELHLDPNAITPAPAALPTPPAHYVTSTVEGIPTTPTLITPGLPSTKAYRMAELGRGMGIAQWIFYAPVFASPTQCWSAVSDFITGEQQQAQETFQSLAQNYGAALWYQSQMQAIEQHRRRMQCVTG